MSLWKLMYGDSSDSIDLLLDQIRLMRNLNEVIKLLPRKQQQILEMLYYQDFRRRDVAKKLRMTPRQVSHQRHLALQTLRDYFQSYLQENQEHQKTDKVYHYRSYSSIELPSQRVQKKRFVRCHQSYHSLSDIETANLIRQCINQRTPQKNINGGT